MLVVIFKVACLSDVFLLLLLFSNCVKVCAFTLLYYLFCVSSGCIPLQLTGSGHILRRCKVDNLGLYSVSISW